MSHKFLQQTAACFNATTGSRRALDESNRVTFKPSTVDNWMLVWTAPVAKIGRDDLCLGDAADACGGATLGAFRLGDAGSCAGNAVI